MPKVVLKTIPEIKAKLREILHRAATRYIRAGLDPRPENCEHAPKLGNKVQPCRTCGAKPGESCKLESQFRGRYTPSELKQMFQELAANREWLVRNLRDAAMLLWVLSQLDPTLEPDPQPLPDHLLREDPPEGSEVWMTFEGDTLRMSPAAVTLVRSLFTTLLKDLPHGAQALEGRTLGHAPGSPTQRP